MTEKSLAGNIGKISLKADTFNQLWQDGYPELSGLSGEVINLDRQSGPVTNKFRQLQMGIPKLSHRGSSSLAFIELEQRALRELEVTLITETGASGRWMSHVRKVELPRDRTLKISISFTPPDPRFKFYYSTLAGKTLRLVWAGAVDCAYNGNGTDARMLTQHYSKQKTAVLYRYGAVPINPWLQIVEARPYSATEEGIWCDLNSPATATMTIGTERVSSAREFDSSIDFGCATFAIHFPENALGLPPVDSKWMASLMVPYGTAVVDPSKVVPIRGLVGFGYKRQPSTAMENPDIGLAGDPLTVSPLVSIVGAGFEKELMEISDLKSATVVFVGDQHGTLEKSSSACYYVPPTSQAPSVIYEDIRKTLEKPAQLETVRERAVFDVIKVTVNANSALSTFVTLYAKQTHYIKCSVVDGALTLQLWYYDVDQGKDVPVPDGETEWSTLHGGGSVSSAGVFTPGSSAPSTVSVIAGRDLGSSRLLYWAVTVIPVPLYSEAQTVAFFND